MAQPARGFLRSRVAPPGPWQPGLRVCVHPQPGWAGRQSSFLQSRDRKQNLEATAKQRTCFLPGTVSVASFPAPPVPWHQSALLGLVPHCLPQDRGLSPPPLPTGPGEAPSHPKMLLPRWLRCPFEFLLLVYCFWDSGLWRKGLTSHLERVTGGKKSEGSRWWV